MDLPAATCTSELKFGQKFSIKYKQSSLSRMRSGSPGYQKGLPILIGTQGTDKFINSQEEGFPLIAGNGNGQCIKDTNAVNQTKLYLTAPPLIFEDNIIYGCSLSFNLAELETFCKNKENVQLWIFKNIKEKMKFVGAYGNANPHFEKDWVKVEY